MLFAFCDAARGASRARLPGHAWRKNWRDAERVAQVGEKYYGERLLPARIETLRLESGGYKEVPKQMSQQMNDYMNRCNASSKPELPEHCKAALTGVNPDSDYQTCGGVLSVIASVTGNQRCDNGGSAKASTGGGAGGIFGAVQ